MDLSPGQLAVNYNSDSTGLYFRTDNGELVKVGPTHVGSDAPPQINWTERSLGELWLDTTDVQSPSLKVYTAAGWSVVNVLDGTITTDKIAFGAVTSSRFTFDGTIIPEEDGVYDIGTSSRNLSVLYTNGLSSGTGTVSLSASILPSATSLDLGSAASKFGTLYTESIFTYDESVIGGNIRPNQDSLYDLGSPTYRFANIYTGDLHLKNDKGDWTLVEAEEYMTLRNNKTGKSFKIVMEPID